MLETGISGTGKVTSAKSTDSIFHWVKLLAPVLIGIVLLSLALAAHFAGPIAQRRVLEELHDQFQADVEMRNFSVSVFPTIRVHGSGLVLRYPVSGNFPPLLSAREFSAEASVWGLLWKPSRVRSVQVSGLIIRIPPKDGNRPRLQPMAKHEAPIVIEKLTAADAQLDIFPNSPNKPHHIFDIHHLEMSSIGLGTGHSATYTAQLTNAVPPGEVDAQGHFGPWDSNEPGQSPLDGNFTFLKANLGYFKGISGTLSSQGKFSGALNEIEVQGETDTPDFMLKLSGHPVALHTTYSATVDGTNGDTLLHAVRANFLHTTIAAKGGVVKAEAGKGRVISLNVAIRGGRLEDLMRLVVKADKPFMTGEVNLHTKMELPTGQGSLIDNLRLTGGFGVEEGEFSDPQVNDKVQELSRRGEGKPGDEDAGSSVSELNGGFTLNDAILNFKELKFEVSGASVQLSGSYGLENEQLDFHGKLRLHAKLSQTVTGVKSVILIPFDPFFRKNKATELPIKVTGTQDAPSFGLDIGHGGTNPR